MQAKKQRSERKAKPRAQVVGRSLDPIVVPEGLTENQRSIWVAIQLEKMKPNPDMKWLRKKAHELTREDAVSEGDIHGFTKGGGSRSPSLGRWNTDDDPADLREAARRGIL